jgi:hypothetical protein
MITFSIIHAAYGRPQKTADAMRMWRERATKPEGVQYIVVSDHCDPKHLEICGAMAKVDGFMFSTFIGHPDTGSARAWNYGAMAAIGEILIQAQDDVEPPLNWDWLLLDKFKIGSGDGWRDFPTVVAASDGYRKDELCSTAIMNRARYKQQGREFLHPGYFSVFSDDEFTYRALWDAKHGTCNFIRARDLVFKHEHHYHNKAVPMDETYERENSSEAYRIGSELFIKRNPEALKDGIRTWG